MDAALQGAAPADNPQFETDAPRIPEKRKRKTTGLAAKTAKPA
jgi:hypothetical protein